MKIQLLSTWKMSQNAMEKVWPLLQGYKTSENLSTKLPWGEALGDLVEEVICQVEDDPALRSVGSEGLPGKTGIVELDAAYMQASGLQVGAAISLRTVKNPITLARYLSHRDKNCILASRGAEALAKELGMQELPPLSKEVRRRWEEACAKHRQQEVYKEQAKEQAQGKEDFSQENSEGNRIQTAGEEAQSGVGQQTGRDEASKNHHDTVCVLGRWEEELVVGVSTSGLFMKEEGRVGDSPLIGSGFYAKKGVGAASATGLGEDILRGCLSYEIVRRMEEGVSPQKACEEALLSLEIQLGKKETCICVIALGAQGGIGAATTMELFPFVYMDEESSPKLLTVRREGTDFYVQEANQDFYHNYTGD